MNSKQNRILLICSFIYFSFICYVLLKQIKDLKKENGDLKRKLNGLERELNRAQLGTF